MSELTKPDFSVRGVVVVLIASFAMVVVALAAIFWIYPEARIDSPARPSDFGAPALEVEPVENYRAWRRRQTDLLAGAEGRMPIEEAMDAIAARGAKAFAPLPEADGTTTEAE